MCVDDFGLDEAVDASVFALAALGRISATGALVDAPRWQADAPRLVREFGDRLDIGLHLNLSEPFPGAPPVHDWARLVLRAYAGLLDRAALRAEVERQLDAFELAAGRAPDFVDGHRHVHQLPGVRQALVDALRARGARTWLRCTLPAAGQGFKATVIGALGGRGLRALAADAGLPQNRAMLGVYGFDADPQRHAQRLTGWVHAAHSGDLLMCHTALPGPPPAGDPIGAARRMEHQLLSGDRFGCLLQEQGVTISRLATRL